jgi:naphthoate synthase
VPDRPDDRVVSELFDPAAWRPVEGFDLTDVTYHRAVVDGPGRGTVRVAFERPGVRNAVRPPTHDGL